MYRLYERGTKVTWKTIDGSTHLGVVQQILRSGKGHSVLEDGQPYPVAIPHEGCIEYVEKCDVGKKEGKK